MVDAAGIDATPPQRDFVFRRALVYDLLVGFVWGGADRRYRRRTVELLELKHGECVLDIGCGTGALAIEAKRAVGGSGRVAGVDASEQMLARARRKAQGRGLDVLFEHGRAQSLPFPDASFDAVVSTTVLHCIASESRGLALAEARRVLKPGGRLLTIDFGGPAATRTSFFGRMKAHRNFDLDAALPDLAQFGFNETARGAIGFSDLRFVHAIAT